MLAAATLAGENDLPIDALRIGHIDGDLFDPLAWTQFRGISAKAVLVRPDRVVCWRHAGPSESRGRAAMSGRRWAAVFAVTDGDASAAHRKKGVPAMTYCVIGCTRGTGLQIARQLAARGAAIRCIARDPVKARDLLPAGVDIRTGDVTDPGSLRRAGLGECRAIFFAVDITGGSAAAASSSPRAGSAR